MHGHLAPDAPSQIFFSRLACLNTHPEKLREQKGGVLAWLGGGWWTEAESAKRTPFFPLSSWLSKQSMPCSVSTPGLPSPMSGGRFNLESVFSLIFSSPNPMPSI